jgi:uncharacterized LabA/DUF88 family protein
MSGKVIIFIDGSNFLGICREFDPLLQIDFDRLAQALVKAVKGGSYEGTYYYASFPPEGYLKSAEEKEHLRKQQGFLEAMEYKEGYTVKRFVRRVRRATCDRCKTETVFTVEKGVDSSIVADMMSLGWEDAYDIAVLLSSDADIKPAVEYLKRFGKKVYHATFANVSKGTDLRKACFGAIDLGDILDEIKR